ncbi:hypothetical protein I4U23_029575 [Adineta vaga]|nr:hypothetical protein I4U23_029575 [Adineta vaga]
MMSDLSNTLRNMKFMQRTSESRKKSLKKPSTTSSQSVPSLPPSNAFISTPNHPGCWRIIKNELTSSPQISTINSNHPSIIYRNSVFSIYDRNYTRLSFQNYNKRIEPLMIKYGLKQDVNPLEDGEIDPEDDDNDDENKTKSINEDNEPKHGTTLGKTIRKKFNKKPFSRLQFDNRTRVTKRKRRTRHKTSTD